LDSLSKLVREQVGGRLSIGSPHFASIPVAASRVDAADVQDVKLPSRSAAVDTLGKSSSGGRTRLDRQIARLAAWADQVIKDAPGQFFVPEIRRCTEPSAAERARNRETIDLYKRTFNTFLWTGFECSNPIVARSKKQRWDQNEVARFYDEDERKKQIKMMMNGLGIENARVGIPNHLIAKADGMIPFDWDIFDPIYKDLQAGTAQRGKVKTALDIMHFGLPDGLHVPDEPEKSDFLNPQWPAHFADFALRAVLRYPEIDAITLINEPFVTNNFSGSHWNEAVHGNRAFISRALLMGEAAVLARIKCEEYLEATNKRKLFLHNDSCEFRSDDQDFNKYKRFLTSDLILGGDWLLADNWDQSEMFAWMKREFGQTKEEQAGLHAAVARIRKAHIQFEQEFGKSMKADTVFGIDYYVTCESGPGITHNPQEYKQQSQKTRKGLYEIGMDYWDRYRLPMMHAETNMREEKGRDWMTQQLIELSSMMKSGIPVLGATWYSLMDQVGWENGLQAPVIRSVQEAKDTNRLNPIGLLTLEGHEMRDSARLMRDLSKALRDPDAGRQIGRAVAAARGERRVSP
jgi:hypothetical protein